jgi:bifunctional non-homologous end joining protein LigD
MPLPWRRVKKGLDPARLSLRTAPALIRKTTGWEDYFEAGRPLADAIARLTKA